MLPAERKYCRAIQGYSLLLPGSAVSFLFIVAMWIAFPAAPITLKAMSLYMLFAVASMFVFLSPLALVAAQKSHARSARILAAFPLTYFIAIPLAAYLGQHGDPRLWIAILLSYIGATMLLSLTMSIEAFREASKKLKEPVIIKLGCHQAHGVTQDIAVNDDSVGGLAQESEILIVPEEKSFIRIAEERHAEA